MAPPPDLYVNLHFIQLTVDKYDAGQQLHKCNYGLKIQDIEKKNSMTFCLIFILILYDNQYHMSAVFVMKKTSANAILSNSSVNNMLILSKIQQYCELCSILSTKILPVK